MNRREVEDRVTSIFRSTALLGSDREIPPKEPLMELGLGLDSLGVIGFIVGLEKTFGIEIPERIWDETEKLSLNYFVELILELKGNSLSKALASINPGTAQGGARRMESVHSTTRRNVLLRLLQTFSRLLGNRLPIYFLAIDRVSQMLDLGTLF